MRVEEFFLRYRIQAPNQDNIRSLAGYLARQMKGIKEFQPLDSQRFTYPILNFLHYANGVFKYGIVCKARAVRLGISQVSSLDKNPRNQNEVEVNCVKKIEGLEIAIHHMAKGAITVATERKKDLLQSKVRIT